MTFFHNSVKLAGNLTRDPEVKLLQNRHAVANFGLAINRRWKGPDGKMKEEATFVDIEAWGHTAELVGQYLTKGRGCFVDGRLKLDSWEDKQTGQKRSRLTVVAEHVSFTDGAPRERSEASAARNGEPPASTPGSLDDEPPF